MSAILCQCHSKVECFDGNLDCKNTFSLFLRLLFLSCHKPLIQILKIKDRKTCPNNQNVTQTPRLNQRKARYDEPISKSLTKIIYTFSHSRVSPLLVLIVSHCIHLMLVLINFKTVTLTMSPFNPSVFVSSSPG